MTMTEHDWQPIAPPEDNGIMCNVCLECKCCSDWTEECPGEWVPDDNWDTIQYADPEEVRKVAAKIVSENQELLKRLAER